MYVCHVGQCLVSVHQRADYHCMPIGRSLPLSSTHAQTKFFLFLLINIDCNKQVMYLVSYPGKVYIKLYQAWWNHKYGRCRHRRHRSIRLESQREIIMTCDDYLATEIRKMISSCIRHLLSKYVSCSTELSMTTWLSCCSSLSRWNIACVQIYWSMMILLSRYCNAFSCRDMNRTQRLHLVCLEREREKKNEIILLWFSF